MVLEDPLDGWWERLESPQCVESTFDSERRGRISRVLVRKCIDVARVQLPEEGSCLLDSNRMEEDGRLNYSSYGYVFVGLMRRKALMGQLVIVLSSEPSQ